jgi:type IV secretion system protein VirB10
MPGVDFELESRLGETITRHRGGTPRGSLGLLLAGCAVAALGYAGYVSMRGARLPPKAENEAFNTARTGVVLGFNKAEAKQDDRLQLPPVPVAVAAPAVSAPMAAALPVIVDDGEARRIAEAERQRREAEARENARLRSGMLVVDAASASTGAFSANAANAGPIKVQGPEEDANRRFLANAGDVETSHANKIARIDALVPQGTMIRATLETAIQSDLPGMVKAITREDVYSFDGRRVLIPSGTMLTGEYRSAMARGQTRVFVIWSRLLRADGISLALGPGGRCRRALFAALRRLDLAEHRRRRQLICRGPELGRPIGDGRRRHRLVRGPPSPNAGPTNGLADLLGPRQSGPQGFHQYFADHQRRSGNSHYCLREARSRFFAMVSRSREGSAL